MISKRFAAALIAITIVGAGCGSGATSGGDSGLTGAAIASQAGFTQRSSGIGWEYQECQIPVILTNEAAIELYAEAGDTVVTDPTGTFGVKSTSAEYPGCTNLISEALGRVK